MPQSHSWDLVAQRAADWVDQTASWIVNALREGGHAPYAAPLSEKEKLAHYEQQLFHPDGSENSLGAQKLMTQFGGVTTPDGRTNLHALSQYAAVKAAVLKARADRVAVAGLPNVEKEE